MNTPHLALALMAEVQEGAELLFNDVVNRLDAIVQLSVIDRTRTTPPGGTPAEGDRYIVAAGATDAWAGKDDQIAIWYGGWDFIVPIPGFRVWVVAESLWLRRDGTFWRLDSRLPVYATGDRPTPGIIGTTVFDSTIGKPIFDNGTIWVLADGTAA